MALSKFLDPKNDVAFRRIFGTEKNKDILIHFLNDILSFTGKNAIQDIEFLSTIQDPEIAAKKQSIVDVLCRDSTGVQWIIEMQVAKTKDTVSLVNKKIIKIVSLLKLYCKTKKYFQFTSCIAVYKLVYMLISKLVLCIQDSRNLLINIYTNQLYSINLCKIPFYIR